MSYRMTVHLFGGTWSPSCCAYALRRTAEDNGGLYSPAAVETITQNFYVDDCLKSMPTVSEAIDLVSEVKDVSCKRRIQSHEVDIKQPRSCLEGTLQRPIQEGPGACAGRTC